MSYIVRWLEHDQLVAATTAAGGTIPAAVAEAIALRDVIQAWEPPPSRDLAALIGRGELTAKNAHGVLTDALVQPNRKPEEVVQTAIWELSSHVAELVRANADELVASLQTPHAAAVAAMAKAEHVVDANCTAEQALERQGGSQAWAALAESRRVLDQINVVVEMLVEHYEVLGQREPWMHRLNIRHAALYCADQSAYNAVQAILNTRNGSGGPRGGRWHFSPGALSLQLPSHAAEMVDSFRQRHIEDEAARYAATHGTVAVDV